MTRERRWPTRAPQRWNARYWRAEEWSGAIAWPPAGYPRLIAVQPAKPRRYLLVAFVGGVWSHPWNSRYRGWGKGRREGSLDIVGGQGSWALLTVISLGAAGYLSLVSRDHISLHDLSTGRNRDLNRF